MNITQITAAVKAAYSSRQPLMIWGPPGVGKSASIREASRQMDEHYRKEKSGRQSEGSAFNLIDLRLSLLDPVDLRGIPFPDQAKGTVKWLKPSFLPTTSRGILLLDEIVQAVPSMQACASQLVLDRCIGEYHLPDGWHVVAAGNRLSDRAATNAMPTHIANRFVHLYAEVDVDSWVTWALEAKVDIRVIAFIKFRRALLHAFDPQSKGQAFPSPRSWEFVSKLITDFKGDRSLLEAMVKGAVGEGPGAEFCGFLRVFDKMPSIDGILLNPERASIPEDPATLYAVITALSNRATKDSMANIAKYFTRITDMGKPDFSVAAMKEISSRDDSLAKTAAFIKWASAHNHIIA